MGKKYNPPISREILYKEYWDNQLSCSKLAKKYGVTNSVIKNWLKKLNIPRRSRSEAATLMWDKDRVRKPKPKKVVPEYKKFDTLYKNHWELGLSFADIAKKYNIHPGTVQYWIKKLNVPVRSRAEAVKNAYETGKVKRKYVRQKMVKVNCTWCGKEIKVWNYRTKKTSEFYCSKECKAKHWSKAKRGSNAFNWKGGHWKETVSKRQWSEYKNARKTVLARDNYKCQLCGSKKKLVTHHIIPVRVDESLMFDVNNLITLCEDCHVNKVNFNEEEFAELFLGIVAKAVNSVDPLTGNAEGNTEPSLPNGA